MASRNICASLPLAYKLHPGIFSSQWLRLNSGAGPWFKGFDLSLQWGFGLVSLFDLQCLLFNEKLISLEPGLEWRWTSFKFPFGPSLCSDCLWPFRAAASSLLSEAAELGTHPVPDRCNCVARMVAPSLGITLVDPLSISGS